MNCTRQPRLCSSAPAALRHVTRNWSSRSGSTMAAKQRRLRSASALVPSRMGASASAHSSTAWRNVGSCGYFLARTAIVSFAEAIVWMRARVPARSRGMARAARGYRVGDDRRRRAAGGRSTASPVAGRATGGLVGLGGTARASASPRAMVGDARSGFARVLVPGRSLQFLAGERRSFAVDAHTRRARAFDFVDAVQRALRLGLRGLGDGVSRRRECALRFETRVLEHELSATRTPARCPTRAAPPRSTRRASLPRRRRSCRRLCRWAARTRRTSSSRARTCGPWASPPRTRRGARGVLKCRRAPRRCRRGRATARGAAPGRGRAAPWSVG